ncbi:DUF2452 domain-containing protein [Flammeovirgaceae bacterium SG7u.111]|nr:DUF2452 domain-containing protein [Flammeovirgaceae bacterium SG7u.132]WPO36218.1 DUF2452 domain-containing protein [Flammeovirgaceae bacterium SG7u.111]
MKKKAIDISDFDFEKEKLKTTETPSTLPYAHTVGGAVIKPENKGKIKSRAMMAMQQQTEAQMEQLYQQMKLLADQANEIKAKVRISERIYMAEMSFEPLINHVYHLYKKEEGKDMLSMVAPGEWGRKQKKIEFLATVKLMADHTWEVLEKNEDAVF